MVNRKTAYDFDIMQRLACNLVKDKRLYLRRVGECTSRHYESNNAYHYI